MRPGGLFYDFYRSWCGEFRVLKNFRGSGAVRNFENLPRTSTDSGAWIPDLAPNHLGLVSNNLEPIPSHFSEPKL